MKVTLCRGLTVCTRISRKLLFIIEKIIARVCVCVLISFNAALIILTAGLFKAAPEYFLNQQTLLWYLIESPNNQAVF